MYTHYNKTYSADLYIVVLLLVEGFVVVGKSGWKGFHEVGDVKGKKKKMREKRGDQGFMRHELPRTPKQPGNQGVVGVDHAANFYTGRGRSRIYEPCRKLTAVEVSSSRRSHPLFFIARSWSLHFLYTFQSNLWIYFLLLILMNTRQNTSSLKFE